MSKSTTGPYGILMSPCVGPYDILVDARRVPLSLSDIALHQGTASGKLGTGWISSLSYLRGKSPLYWAVCTAPCGCPACSFLDLPAQWVGPGSPMGPMSW